MAPRILATTASATTQFDSTVYSLDLLADYAHTLDALPLDLSRIFADLRELDAVLTSTISSLTAKVYQLIDLVENHSASNEQRLWLLGEIADEASKVRPGADDKIRIATTAADTLRVQSSYLTDLVTTLPDFETHLLVKRTAFPHVSAKAYAMPSSFETGRRRRAPNNAGAWLGVAEGSPNKKRRVLQEEDLDYNAGKSPAKQKSGDGGQRAPRGGQRPKKTDRHPSPSDSLHSIQSPMPGHNVAAGVQRSGGTGQRAGQGGGSSKRRPNNQNGDNASLLDAVLNHRDNGHGHPPSSTHPSLPKVDSIRSHEAGNSHGRNNNGHSGRSGNHNGDVTGANDQHLDGLGVSGARASTQSSLTTNMETMNGSPAPGGAATTPATAVDGVDGDGEGDNEDNKTYCYCENVSYGEMIGCDGADCVREWFHLACVGLTATPKGQWFCDECTAKRRRSKQNGKKRAGGGGRTNQRSNGI